ncbi:serine-protein kinase ATM isoform X2 [Thrips palmi]|nr:serine-protein kinase ATM isoform X2 [Thrips palmi]
MESRLWNLVDECQSLKSAQRKKAVAELSEILFNPDVVQLLHRNSNSDRVNWSVLFNVTFGALKSESECWKNDEGKGSAQVQTNREKSKTQFSGLIIKVLKKANEFSPTLNSDDVLGACVYVLSDLYLRRNFGTSFSAIIQDYVLPVRKYRTKLRNDQWEDLLDCVLDHLKCIAEERNSGALHSECDLVKKVIHYGCKQSHLCIQVKNKLLPFLREKFDAIYDGNPAAQEALLSLALCVCTIVAKETRSGVCQLGESILASVIRMFDSKLGDKSPRNKVVVDFLLFQMQCHHPNGARQGSDAAYACNWNRWNDHLNSMYRAVFGMISRRSKGLGYSPFSDGFLDLSVALCYQLFDKSKLAYEISLSIIETQQGPAAKKRKCLISVEEIFDELQSCRKNPSWALISFVSRILEKHPDIFQDCELLKLLDILCDMLFNCNNKEPLTHIHSCCEHLSKVMSERNLETDKWLRVWDKISKSPGSNESGCLLRRLIAGGVPSISDLEQLIRMYVKSSIQLSNDSLQTLITLLSFYHLPENSGGCDDSNMFAMWEFIPMSSARVGLLRWLCSAQRNVAIDTQLQAQILSILVVKTKHDPSKLKSGKATTCIQLKQSSLETDYCLNVFESGLLQPPNKGGSVFDHTVSSNYISSCIVDKSSLKLLEDLMRDKYFSLHQKFTDLASSTQRTIDSWKLKVELSCGTIDFARLMVNLMSLLMEYGVFSEESFSDSYFDDGFKEAMKILKALLPDILKAENGQISEISKTYDVLKSLCLLYGSDLLPPVSSHLCEETHPEIIVPIVDLLSSNLQHDGTNISSTFSSTILEDTVLTDVDLIKDRCLRVLTLYAFPVNGIKFISKQKSVSTRVLEILSDSEIFNLASEAEFMMIHQSLSIMLTQKRLDQEKHVKKILEFMQKLCKTWSKDAEASCYVLSHLKDVFKYVSGKWERCASATLLAPFKNKQYGPEFTVQFISCIEELLRVDEDSKWAKWLTSNVSSLRQIVDVQIPKAALQTFEDENRVAIVEEAIFFLLNPFHEVRLAVVPSVVGLLAGLHHTTPWMQTMFERLSVVLRQLLIIEEGNIYQADEISNRTAVVLHVLVAVIATSVKCYDQAILLVLCLVKEKKVKLDLVIKVFGLLEKAMKLKCVKSFFGKSLAYLLQKWLSLGFELKHFPFAVFKVPSFTDFLNHYKGIILPVVCKCNDQQRHFTAICQEIHSDPSEVLAAAFPSIYAHYLPCLADSAVSEHRSHNLLTSTLGLDRVKDLALAKIEDILIELTKLVWDPPRHEVMLGLDPKSTPPRPPYISQDDFTSSLKYLQKVFQLEVDLLVHIGRKSPIIFQKVLLKLREDLVNTIPLDQSIKALHSYTMFAQAIAFHLQSGEYRDLEFFVLSDVTYTLLYLIRENRQDPLKHDVCIGSCSFLHVLYQQLLPDCASTLNDLLPTIVGWLIPLSEGTDVLAVRSLKLMKLLLLDNSTHLKEAVGKLPPFPDTDKFQEINSLHCQLKYQGSSFTLEEEIRHFLSSAGSTSILASQDTMFDALVFLRKKLYEMKTELADLYQGLVHIRGFSSDCQKSILHQLICKLINLTSSTNLKVQIEASRCLGEIGPADLTTTVLRPVEGCLKLVEGYRDPMLCVMVVAAHLASEYLLDHDVNVVKKASCVLESLMLCEGSDNFHSTTERPITNCLRSKKISPFIPEQSTKLTSKPKMSDRDSLINMISSEEIWFPPEDTKHNDWITNLVSSLIACLSDDIIFKNLAALCKVKSSFGEEMLPVLFYLGLRYSANICQRLSLRLSQFFQKHTTAYSNSQTPNLSATTTNIFLDRASVQCMLNVVNYVRLKKCDKYENDEAICLDVNYLHVASAAQFCSAYLSSIMYMELWCNTEDRHADFDGSSVAYVDYLYEIKEDEGKILQSLLSKAYQQIGDTDALYGCGSSMLLNSEHRVSQFEYIGKWDKALLNYDAKLLHSKDGREINGLVNALKHSGLVHLLNTFVSSLPPNSNEQVLSAQVECMWRLGEWGKPLPPASKALGFEWNQYSALQAIRDGNKSIVNECVKEGRLSVLKDLAYSSLEICKNIYKPLAQLQALQEIEDFILEDDTQKIVDKWKNQGSLPFNDIYLLEPILAQRAKLMENLIFQKNVEENPSQNTNYLEKKLTQHYLDTAVLARKKEQVQIAEQWLHCLSIMPHLNDENKRRICLEEAQLAWDSCKGSNDVGTTSVARQLLGSLLKDLKATEKGSTTISPLLPEAYILYGRWMAEARSENPQQIIEDYLQEALKLLEKIPAHLRVNEHLFQAHCCLAHFADLEYQRITAYIKSELFQSKVECMEKLTGEANQINQQAKEGTEEQQRAVRLTIMCSKLDREEIKNTYDEQNQFIELALRHYLKSMNLGHGDNLPVFRLVSLWLENADHDAVNNLVSSSLEEIQTYKFIVLLPQLAARIGDNLKDTLSKAIFKLLTRCCRDHPHHALPHILALANSYEDFEGKVKPNPEARVLGASLMLSELRRNERVNDIVTEMDKLAKALISLAYAAIPAHNAKVYKIQNSEKIRKIQNLQHAMLPTISLPVQSDAKYDNIIRILDFATSYEIAGGINRPKKIMCRGTDGIKRPLLVKGRDDLRQDAVMQQVFNIMNTLLQDCQETKRRRLLIRTYKIVPLSQRCGVLEWCQNTAPFQEVLRSVHSRYNAQDWKDVVCMKKIENARNKSNTERLNVFKEICRNFHPAFRFFFTEKFPTPAEWFDRRLAYVHSVATNSMVGYILGLGDRHVSNILIDNSTAEMIHIDFGIAFDQGKVLPTPETVPFRLTRDVVDGMGLSGVEGVFRRSCEKTMAVLRRNQEKILTILEVLLYDPLYAWSLTPKMAAKRQKGKSNSSDASVSSVDSEGKVSNTEKNKMAERVLCRLKEKLLGTEDGPASSIEGQVNRLIQQARDVANLSRLFKGWQAYF